MSILIVVVLPAPFGPRNAKISPWPTSNEIWSTAVNSPKRFTRSSTRIMGSSGGRKERPSVHYVRIDGIFECLAVRYVRENPDQVPGQGPADCACSCRNSHEKS